MKTRHSVLGWTPAEDLRWWSFKSCGRGRMIVAVRRKIPSAAPRGLIFTRSAAQLPAPEGGEGGNMFCNPTLPHMGFEEFFFEEIGDGRRCALPERHSDAVALVIAVPRRFLATVRCQDHNQGHKSRRWCLLDALLADSSVASSRRISADDPACGSINSSGNVFKHLQ